MAATMLLASSTVFAQARVASLDWMTGTWVHTKDGEKVTESWVGPGNGVMVAANLSTWPNGKKFFEFLRIADTADGFSYFASPAGRPPVEFKMKEAAQQRVVFENTAHDYPQRILYWRDGDALMARIEGAAGGKTKSEEWRFVKDAD
jgi:hypothetical protein